ALRSGTSLIMAVIGIAAVCYPAARLVEMLAKRNEEVDVSPAAGIYLSFWGLSVITLAAGYILTSVASGKGQLRIPPGTGDEATRYVVPLFFAAAASVPLWAARFPPRRLVASGAAGLFALLSLASVSGMMEEQPLLASKSADIAGYLSSRDVEKGYAAYWDAHSLSLAAKGKVTAHPVFHCHRDKPRLCPFVVNVRTDWYRPDAKRTFLLTDPTVPGALVPPGSGLGKPIEVRRFGRITVYLYERDIAESFSKGCGGTYFC
ncbi:MAG: hypothetical protein ACRDIU_05525, partial [Actinomycetota bacterium]